MATEVASNSEILSSPEQPSRINSLSSNDDCIELMTRAYAKVILHAAKYPHASVNGVLLAKLPSKGEKIGSKLVLIDAIPLFHQTEGLSPMLEVALTQIESRTASIGYGIAGFYHASRHFRDTSVDIFSQRIADRIADLSPFGRTALLTVNNREISLNLQNHALLGQMFIGNSEGTGRWRTIAKDHIRVEDDMTFAVTSQLLLTRGYKDLSDFDNHLDDVSIDYLNVSLNIEIDKAS